MDIPDTWRAYQCGDYFGSPLAMTGAWDADAQIWYVEPAEGLVEDANRGFLIIGRPGVDGITWGYRKGRPGIWVHYPLEDRFEHIADSATALHERWRSGQILL